MMISRIAVGFVCLLISFHVASASEPVALTFDSSLFTKNDVEVKTRLTGVIEKIYVDRGSKVSKGSPLANLQNDDLAVEIKKAEVTMKQAKAEYDRAKLLFDQKLLSESEYDVRKLTFDEASAELDLAKVNYEKSIIKAPFAGLVEEVYARIGQRVADDDETALFRITAMEPLQARIFVPEDQLSRVSAGQKAEFVSVVLPNRRFFGKVKWISETIDAASGTAPAIIELLPGQGRGILKPGASGKVTIWVAQASGNEKSSK